MIFELPDIRDTRCGKELIEEGRAEGYKQGYNEGYLEGYQQGMQLAAIKVARHFAEVSPDTGAQIRQLCLADVERLVKDLSKTDAPVDLDRWLQSGPHAS